MSKSINCSSCGAENQMLEGKDSMFCAFCGTSIQEVITLTTLNTPSTQKTKPEEKPYFFSLIIASMSTWNWITLFSPYLLAALVIKIGFHSSFLGILIFCYMSVIFLFFAPYMEQNVKTGRSFKTKYGKIEEYQTKQIGGTIDSGKMAGNIILIHFISMIICIFIFFKTANNNSQTPISNNVSIERDSTSIANPSDTPYK